MPDEIEQDVRAAIKNVSPRVAAALEALWRRLPDSACIENAAKDLKIHRTTLLRWFHDDLGMSPKQALQQLRLTRAQRRMQETDEPLATVAMQSGYGSFQSMVRHFRQVFRTTPAQIRARKVSGWALAPGEKISRRALAPGSIEQAGGLRLKAGKQEPVATTAQTPISRRALAPGSCTTEIEITGSGKKHPAPMLPTAALTDHRSLIPDPS